MSNITFAYIRISHKSQDFRSQIEEITRHYPDAEIYQEQVSGIVKTSERPILRELLGKLRRGDTLVVWWIDRLSRLYHESDALVRDILAKGVTIKTINQNMTFEYSGDDIKDLTTNIMLSMLTAMAAAERKSRLSSARAAIDSIKKDPALRAEKYKGRLPDLKMHKNVINLLSQGQSMRSIAKELGISLNTVVRVKKKYA